MGNRERSTNKTIFSLLTKFILCLVFLCLVSFKDVFAADQYKLTKLSSLITEDGKHFTVHPEYEGIVLTGTRSGTYDAGTNVTISGYLVPGYTFDGWYVDVDNDGFVSNDTLLSTELSYQTVLNSNMTIYPKTVKKDVAIIVGNESIKYKNLQDAIDAANDGDVVKLIDDVAIADRKSYVFNDYNWSEYHEYDFYRDEWDWRNTSDSIIIDNKDLTIDFNGYTIKGCPDEKGVPVYEEDLGVVIGNMHEYRFFDDNGIFLDEFYYKGNGQTSLANSGLTLEKWFNFPNYFDTCFTVKGSSNLILKSTCPDGNGGLKNGVIANFEGSDINNGVSASAIFVDTGSTVHIENVTIDKCGVDYSGYPNSLATKPRRAITVNGALYMEEGSVISNCTSSDYFEGSVICAEGNGGSFYLRGGTIEDCYSDMNSVIAVGGNSSIHLEYGIITDCNCGRSALISSSNYDYNNELDCVVIGEENPPSDRFMLIQGCTDSWPNGTIYQNTDGRGRLTINNTAILNCGYTDSNTNPISIPSNGGDPVVTINGGIFILDVGSDIGQMIDGTDYAISPDAEPLSHERDANGNYIVKGKNYVDRDYKAILGDRYQPLTIEPFIAVTDDGKKGFQSFQQIFSIEYPQTTVRLLQDIVVDDTDGDDTIQMRNMALFTNCDKTLDLYGYTVSGSSDGVTKHKDSLFDLGSNYSVSFRVTSTKTDDNGNIVNGKITMFGNSVFNVISSYSVLDLDHVTISNCGSSECEKGGAVHIQSMGTVNLNEGTIIENCSAKKGNAVYVCHANTLQGNLHINGATIKNCTGGIGAIYSECGFVDFAYGTIENCLSSSNSGGSAIYSDGSSFNTLNGSVIIGEDNPVDGHKAIIKNCDNGSTNGSIYLKNGTNKFKNTAVIDGAAQTINLVGGSATLYGGSSYSFKPILDANGMFTGTGTLEIASGSEVPDSKTGDYYVISDAREPATVGTPPVLSSVELCFDGTNPVDLLTTEGTTNDGEMMYCVTTTDVVPTVGFTNAKPQVSSSGTFYVWYFVKGDAAHKNSNITRLGSIDVKGPGNVTAPVILGSTLYYANGNPVALLRTQATSNTGTVMYCVSTSKDVAPAASEFSASSPTTTELGTYYVWYYSKGTGLYTDSAFAYVGPITITQYVPPVDPTPSGGNDDWTEEEEEQPRRFVSVAKTTPTVTNLDNITFIRSSFDPNAYANIGSPLLVLVDNDSLTSQTKKLSVDLKNYKKDKTLVPTYLSNISGSLSLYDSLFNNNQLSINTVSEMINEQNEDVDKIAKFTDGISKELKCTPFINTYFSADLFLCSNGSPIARITNVDRPIRFALILDNTTYEQVKGKRSYLVTLHEGSLSYKSVSFNSNIIYLDLDEFSSFSVFFADELIQLEEKQVEKINNTIFIPDFVSKIAAAGVFSITLIIVILILRKKPKHAER